MIDASPARLAAVWDSAAELPGAQRSRALLALDAGRDCDVDAWTLGRCDASLARIFGALFGDAVEATVGCTACVAPLEFETTLDALFGGHPGDDPGPFALRCDGYEVALRPLRLGDVVGLSSAPAQALERILRRCVIEARHDGRPVDVALFPAALCEAISEALRSADPFAEIVITLTCADCAHENSVAFDIGTFLWEALDRCVTQTLVDVHVLAATYGWPEREILALPESRRRRYLELIAG